MKLGICEVIDPYCKNFNKRLGLCEECYPGYASVNNKCVIATQN